MWKHRNDATDEVGGVAAFLGFFVEVCVLFNVSRDVGDVDTDARESIYLIDRDGIVEVFSVIRVDCKSEMVTDIHSVFDSRFAYGSGDVICFLGDVDWELRLKFVFAKDGFEFGSGSVGASEDFDNFSGWGEVTIFPFVDADDDFILEGGFDKASVLFGRSDYDVLREGWVIGDDVIKVLRFLESTDDGIINAFENADYTAVDGFVFGDVERSFIGFATAVA